jgi:hypothetical protein
MKKHTKIVNCPPFGDVELFYESGYIREVIGFGAYRRVLLKWREYWQQMLPAVIETMKDYEKPNLFGKEKFRILLMKSGGWIDDEVMFELLFENDPAGFSIAWVTAFKNDLIIHKQASF